MKEAGRMNQYELLGQIAKQKEVLDEVARWIGTGFVFRFPYLHGVRSDD
jgi:hypothetical protein